MLRGNYFPRILLQRGRSIQLSASQVAFVNRVGADGLSATGLKLIINSEPEAESEAIEVGDRCLRYFAREYLSARFPSLPERYLQSSLTGTYLAPQHLEHLARFLGFVGVLEPVGDDSVSIRDRVLAKFKMFLGASGQERGPLHVRNFLDSRYFNNTHFDVDELVRPTYPVPDLVQLLLPQKIHFRLLQESGRISNESMYVVGVFSENQTKPIGEGYGAAIILAQQRAAIDALRKRFLKENPITVRPSDLFKSISDIPNSN